VIRLSARLLAAGGAVALLLAGCSSGEADKAGPGPGVSPSAPTTPGQRWVPRPAMPWQWQLKGDLDLEVDVPVYDVDAVTTSAAQVAELHRKGRRVICYVNVGAHEDFRPDQAAFPAAVLGEPLEGWPGERWVDIRQWSALRPILSARFDLCRAKGFDAVEPDNVDAYDNKSGFDLTAEDQLRFNRRIASLAHDRGLSVALKNDLDQASVLEPWFDFAVNEQCVEFDECEKLLPFVRAGKAVLHVEYDLAPGEFCRRTRAFGFSSMRKPIDLGKAREAC
jgi:hypothetical protein